MRRFILTLMLATVAVLSFAQPGKDVQAKFDPRQFETDLERYVLKEADITSTERTKFLTIFREMRKKQVDLMTRERKVRDDRATTEEQWQKAMKVHDETQVQLKKVQQTYHNQMLKVIPASKIMRVVKAEDEFHRKTLMDTQARGHGGKNAPGGKR